ncbi:transmembrane protein 56 [Iris pallida]|uniref:Transmembrane protein 56 n=1 Tax=Iris pallida TaxID=29817 RepID=A0AAX6DFU8_IRIPA|nr:transmembrane protein 56 [Iris pallida]
MEGNFGPTEQVLWPVSVFSGIVMCKIVYELTGQISLLYFNKCYNKLNKSQKIEWNNRGFSTFHAIVAAAVSFYLLVLSDTFKDGNPDVLVVHNKSVLSDAMFGISLGYFLSDLAMILWLFPSLGGKEYILHHGLSIYAMLLSLISGKGQIYILMVLFSEITTPFVNLRWYLDLAGQKSSSLYVYNGVALFLGWLVCLRISPESFYETDQEFLCTISQKKGGFKVIFSANMLANLHCCLSESELLKRLQGSFSSSMFSPTCIFILIR